jgi:hypothetical protein
MASCGEPPLRRVPNPKEHAAARIGEPARAAGTQGAFDRSSNYFLRVTHFASDFTRDLLLERIDAGSRER